jgi:hypothetical protein
VAHGVHMASTVRIRRRWCAGVPSHASAVRPVPITVFAAVVAAVTVAVVVVVATAVLSTRTTVPKLTGRSVSANAAKKKVAAEGCSHSIWLPLSPIVLASLSLRPWLIILQVPRPPWVHPNGTSRCNWPPASNGFIAPHAVARIRTVAHATATQVLAPFVHDDLAVVIARRSR